MTFKRVPTFNRTWIHFLLIWVLILTGIRFLAVVFYRSPPDSYPTQTFTQ